MYLSRMSLHVLCWTYICNCPTITGRAATHEGCEEEIILLSFSLLLLSLFFPSLSHYLHYPMSKYEEGNLFRPSYIPLSTLLNGDLSLSYIPLSTLLIGDLSFFGKQLISGSLSSKRVNIIVFVLFGQKFVQTQFVLWSSKGCLLKIINGYLARMEMR